jgi:hypothetical protein
MTRYLNTTGKEMSIDLKLDAFAIEGTKDESCYVQEIVWTMLDKYSDVMTANVTNSRYLGTIVT